jgi:NADPH:quinone reductase-like Zn-dependent oxidoreductase
MPGAGMTFEQAAGVPVGFMTAYHGLVQRGHLRKGEHVVVTGASGLYTWTCMHNVFSSGL